MKTALFTVTNDLYTDQRVKKMARSLQQLGYRVVLTGRHQGRENMFAPLAHKTYRLRCFFHKGPLFYAGFNIRLFFLLLILRYDLLVANDLDSLAAAHLASRIRRKPLVYDTHEYFTGAPEIEKRPLVRFIWRALEKWLFPRQQTIITVNDSIARLYEKEFGKKLYVIRNVPQYREPAGLPTRSELALPEDRRILLLQGTGINTDRGGEELIQAMRPEYGLKDVLLLIIGSGNVLPLLKKKVSGHSLQDRIWFIDPMPYEKLFAYTAAVDLGLSLDKGDSLNYLYSLPNKLFDYVMAGTPVLVSDLPEVARIVNQYQLGRICPEHEPARIARCINDMLSDQSAMRQYRQNCLIAAKELCWERESEKLKEIYSGWSV